MRRLHLILNLSYVKRAVWSELLDIQSARYDTNRMVPDIANEVFEDNKGVIRIRISKKNKTTQWPKEKVQRSTKHTHKAKDRLTRTPQKKRGNSGAPEK